MSPAGLQPAYPCSFHPLWPGPNSNHGARAAAGRERRKRRKNGGRGARCPISLKNTPVLFESQKGWKEREHGMGQLKRLPFSCCILLCSSMWTGKNGGTWALKAVSLGRKHHLHTQLTSLESWAQSLHVLYERTSFSPACLWMVYCHKGCWEGLSLNYSDYADSKPWRHTPERMNIKVLPLILLSQKRTEVRGENTKIKHARKFLTVVEQKIDKYFP